MQLPIGAKGSRTFFATLHSLLVLVELLGKPYIGNLYWHIFLTQLTKVFGW
jgi:hypothetical protein